MNRLDRLLADPKNRPIASFFLINPGVYRVSGLLPEMFFVMWESQKY